MVDAFTIVCSRWFPPCVCLDTIEYSSLGRPRNSFGPNWSFFGLGPVEVMKPIDTHTMYPNLSLAMLSSLKLVENWFTNWCLSESNFNDEENSESFLVYAQDNRIISWREAFHTRSNVVALDRPTHSRKRCSPGPHMSELTSFLRYIIVIWLEAIAMQLYAVCTSITYLMN